MLRRHHRFFQSLQIARDVLLVGLAFILAYLFRFNTGLLPEGSVANPQDTNAIAIMVVTVWPVIAWISRVYVSHRTRSMTAEIFIIFKATLIAFLVLVTITYFVREVRYSRAILIFWAFFAFTLVSFGRTLSRIILRSFRTKGFNLRHVLVVGVGRLASRVIEVIQNQSPLGIRLVGIITHENDKHLVGQHIKSIPVIGTISELKSICQKRKDQGHTLDQVLVALPIEKMGALKKIMETLSQETVDVRLIPDLYQYVTLCGGVEEFSGLPMINLQSTPLTGWNLVGKRIFDILFAFVGLCILSPVMLILGLVIFITSRGPILFCQRRVGMDGREFNMYKFRTMKIDSESNGAMMTSSNDPRCTQLGKLMRRTSLDELPQLWNVLKGDMSLVGPRPEQPAFIEDFKKEIPRYALRHKIKAGMTGWAQINGMRGNTSIAKRIELDLYYIENWSLSLDAKILLRTLLGGFISPNAY